MPTTRCSGPQTSFKEARSAGMMPFVSPSTNLERGIDQPHPPGTPTTSPTRGDHG